MYKHKPTDFKLQDGTLKGFYRGVVEDNNDPLRAGRVRVRIWGLHTSVKVKEESEGIPTNELPWAEPMLPIMEGGNSGYGIFAVPLQGSHVLVVFENGNPLRPLYLGSLPAKPTSGPNTSEGFNDPDGVYPSRTGQPDWENKAGTYPNNFVIQVHGQHYIEIDSSSGNKRIKIHHSSGSDIEIADNGDITVTGVNDETVNITNNQTVNVGAAQDITAGTTRTIDCGTDHTETVGGNMQITVTGNVTLTGTAINITGSGAVTISGSPVNIN